VNGSLVVVDDVASAFTEFVLGQIRSAEGSPFSIAFSGGGTARSCYESLARIGAQSVDWSAVHAWWGDERCVPLDHPDSNYRLVDESLLSQVSPLGSVLPMRSDVPSPAEDYNSLVAAAAPIDVVHLGLGPDGHTASLFPQSTALDAPSDRLVVANVDPLGNNPHDRLTFTFSGIARCRTILVTVAGVEKQEALHRVLDGDQSAPAARLTGENIIWLVDDHAVGSKTIR